MGGLFTTLATRCLSAIADLLTVGRAFPYGEPTRLALPLLWASSLGLVTLEVVQRWRQGKKTDEIRDILERSVLQSDLLWQELLKSKPNPLRDDQLEKALKELDLNSIPHDDPTRPYVVFYRFLKGDISDMLKFQKEILSTVDATQKLIEGNARRQEQLAAFLLSEARSSSDLLEKLDFDVATLMEEYGAAQRQVLQSLDQLKPRPPLDLTLIAPDAALNRFNYRAMRVDLFGREEEMSLLREFLAKPCEPGGVDLWWWLWIGPGGMGKSRLALELCLEAQAGGFRAGFFPASSTFQDWEKWQVDEPTLIVVDYLAIRAESIRAAIVALRNNPGNIKAPVRFLLLERSADDDDRWWKQFRWGVSSGDTESLNLCAHGGQRPADWSRPLEPLTDEARWRIVTTILDESGTPHPDREATLAAIGRIDPHHRPLFATLAAESVAEHGGLQHVREWNQETLAEHILKQEFNGSWQRNGVDDPHLNLLTLATVVGRQEERICDDLHRRDIPIPNADEIRRDWVRLMTGYTGPWCEDGEAMVPLEPDLLGEMYVLQRLAGKLHLHEKTPIATGNQTRQVLQAAWCCFPIETAEFVGRCARDFPSPVDARFEEAIESLARLSDDCEMFVAPVGRAHQSARLIRGNWLQASGRRKLAITDYTHVINHALPIPEFVAEALYNRGLCYGEEGDVQRELRDYTCLIKLPETSIDLKVKGLFNRAVAYEQQGDLNAAEADYTQLIELSDAPSEAVARALFNRAVMYRNQGNMERAMAHYTHLIKMPDAPATYVGQALVHRGEMHGEQGNLPSARADYAHVIGMADVRPDDLATALFNRAVTYREEDDLPSALADYTRLIELPDASAVHVAQALANRAVVYAKMLDIDSAHRDSTRVIEMRETVPDQLAAALYNRALANQETRDLTAARGDYTRLIEMSDAPQELIARALVNRGAIYSLEKALDAAIEDYTRVIAMANAPNESKALSLFNRAVDYGEQGKLGLALCDFTGLIEMPNAPPKEVAQALVNRGLIYNQQGNTDVAVADLQRALKLEALNPREAEQVERLVSRITRGE